MNNFEKIKQMSVDEMAEFLDCFEDTYSKCDFCIWWKKSETLKNGYEYMKCTNKEAICEEGIKQYLLQEVENV